MARKKSGAPTEKPPRIRQGRLEGMVPRKIQEIEDAAEAYDEKVRERMGLTEEEVTLHDDLLKLMEKHKVNEYRRGNTIFRINEGKRKVKRVRVDDKDGEAEGLETDGLEEVERGAAAE